MVGTRIGVGSLILTHFTSLSLRFLICKVGTIIPNLKFIV